MDAVARFAELVDRPAEAVDLGRAALAFAAAADPLVAPGVWLEELDRLAAGVGDFEALRRRLFSERGFTGAVEDYDSPENSLLHRVLERRRGIPISLSVVALEVGARAGVPVQGVGMPGHFLIRDPVAARLCDPFHAGALIDEEDGREGLRRAGLGGELPIADAHQILIRMLNNLANVYRRLGQGEDLEWVLRCQRAIPGAQVEAALGLGKALADRGRFLQAAKELEETARQVGPAEAQGLLQAAQAVRARLN